MNTPRVIPILLLKGEGLVKGIAFKDHKYVGDPINAVRIFNDKEVDELVFLDIDASQKGRKPNIDLIRKLADECYMPFAAGGGITDVDEIRGILEAGAEKVSINTAAVKNPELIREASSIFGSQSIVVSIDVRKNWLGKYLVCAKSGSEQTDLDPVQFAKKMQALGAGEILLTRIENDGTMNGYDLVLIKKIAEVLEIPLIACGGAGKMEDFSSALKEGASAVAAGAKFVLHGKHRAVLITYPDKKELEMLNPI
ncbi:MAG: imidazole glycerol phosphate synthase subunit HisF [Lentisphaerae bacterium GWF2_49_21]|nr:MAG: imidazole glycerol phosphate synthase subunit HisF [Lentisphaerae bacterium GWF2_49_21]